MIKRGVKGAIFLAAITLYAGQASSVYINGKWYAKGVRCVYELAGTGSSSTGMCKWETSEALLQCINQGENQGSETTFVNTLLIGKGLTPGIPGSKPGRSAYNAVSNANGVAATDAECDASADCNVLRQYCTSGTWVPTDVVPTKLCAVFSAYSCKSKDQCPCDPNVPGNCSDGDPKTPGTDPISSPDKVYCELPDPASFQFGDSREYQCVPATPALCPSLFPTP